MAWLSHKVVILVVATLADCAPGYNYNRPDVALEAPSQSVQVPQHGPPLHPGQIYQKTVSYSISHEDYAYLKRQKDEHAQHNVHIHQPIQEQHHINNLDTGVANTILQADLNKQIVHNDAPHIHDSVPVVNVQSSAPSYNGNLAPVLQLQPPVLAPNYYNPQINNALNAQSDVQQIVNVQNVPVVANIPVVSNVPVVPNAPVVNNIPVVQSNPLPVNVQIAPGQNYQNNVQQFIPAQPLQPLVNVNVPQYNLPSNQVSAPLITKHIYFHVPPPDVEPPRPIPIPPPPKKTYKILFIKLPAQVSSNAIQQLQARLNPVAPIEEKTLIYVLHKKPEEPQVVIPPAPKLSEHEVLFVKYKDNPITNAEEVERVVEIPQRKIATQVLQPGIVNGQW